MRLRSSSKNMTAVGSTGVNVVKTSAVGGMRQLRCPRCHGMAVPTKDVKGNAVMKCGQCGTTFSSRQI